MADFPTAKTEAVDNVTDVLAKHVNNLEDKVGIDGSVDTDSLDYKVNHFSETDPVYTAWDKDYDDLTNTPTIPTRDSLGLDTDDTVTFANLSGTNTGDNATNSNYSGLDTAKLNIDQTTPQTTVGTFTFPVLHTPTINGGILANDDITIQSTTHATKTTSYVILQPTSGNVGIGTTSPNNLLQVNDLISFTNADWRTQIGYQAGKYDLGQYNTWIGYQAGSANNSTGKTDAADYNTAVGYQALYSNTTGSRNSAQGYAALHSNTTGNRNSAQGVYALHSNTTGSYNSAQGYAALRYNTTGSYNSAQGMYALYSNTTGSYNSAQGVYALYSNTTGIRNSAQGYAALHSNTIGSSNTGVGYNTGRGITYGSGNTILGANVTGLAAGLTNNIILANGTGAIKAQNDGTDWNFTGNVGIEITAPTAKLHIVGSADTQQLIVKGNATQTANLVEIQNSSATVLVKVSGTGVFFPLQAATASAPAYVKGGLYFDLTLNKLMVGGATGWEALSSA